MNSTTTMLTAIVHVPHSLKGPFVIGHRDTTILPRRSITEEVDALSVKIKAIQLHTMKAQWDRDTIAFTPRRTLCIYDRRTPTQEWIAMPYDRQLRFHHILDFLQMTWCSLTDCYIESRRGRHIQPRAQHERVGHASHIVLHVGYKVLATDDTRIRVRRHDMISVYCR